MTMIYITIFCAGNLYFSNKKNKVTINYCSRFCLRIDDQLRRCRETKRTVCVCSSVFKSQLGTRHSEQYETFTFEPALDLKANQSGWGPWLFFFLFVFLVSRVKSPAAFDAFWVEPEATAARAACIHQQVMGAAGVGWWFDRGSFL